MTNKKQQEHRRRGNIHNTAQSYFLAALLFSSFNAARALQINNKNQGRSQVYYTSVAKTKCAHPRPVASSKTEYQRNPSIILGIDREYHAQEPNQIPFQRQHLEKSTIRPVALSPVMTTTPSKVLLVPQTTRNNAVSDGNNKNNPPSRKSLIHLGCVLAANSGFLNGLGLSGVLGKVAAVSAVTSTYTNAAVAFSQQLSPSAMAMVLATPLWYMLGSTVNGVLNYELKGLENNMGNLGLVQTAPLLLAGILMLAAKAIIMSHHRIVPATTLAMLTFVMGLQNSWTSMILQGNLLRTAHFSGITSDFGTALGQTLRGNHANTFKLPIFAKLAASFWMGGMMSVVGIQRLGLSAPSCLTASSLVYLGLWTVWTMPIRKLLLRQRQQTQKQAPKFLLFDGLIHDENSWL